MASLSRSAERQHDEMTPQKHEVSLILPPDGLTKETEVARDDGSVGSYSTLFSNGSRESSDESSSSASGQDTADEMMQLHAKFDERDYLLRQICRNKSPEYARMLRETEHVVQAEAFRLLALKQKKRAREDEMSDGSKQNASTASVNKDKDPQSQRRKRKPVEADGNSPIKKFSLLQMIHRNLALEFNHGVKGYLTITLFCAAHMSLYELVSTAVSEITKNVKSQALVDICTLLLGLFLSRISGYVWYYVNKDSHRCVKFDFHNRLRLGDWDARILRWFRRRNALQASVGIIGLYLCFIPVVNVQSRMLSMADMRQQLLADLPSADSGNEPTWMARALSYGMKRATPVMEPTCSSDDACAAGEELAELALQDEAYVYAKLSVSSFYQIMGSSSVAAVSGVHSLVYYGILVTIYIRLLTILDFSFASNV